MIPAHIIEKAVEGGWSGVSLEEKGKWVGGRVEGIEHYWHSIALDPSFWQSLGKVLGWTKNICTDCLTPYVDKTSCTCGMSYPPLDDTWHLHAMRFYDLILTGGDTDAFWEELLEGK